MATNNSRRRGHDYERLITKELKEMGYDVVTARSESRNMDNKGIDIFGDIPFHIQCKLSKDRPNYHDLITSPLLDDETKPLVVFHKLATKANSRFMVKGEYVIMKKSVFYELIEKTNG